MIEKKFLTFLLVGGLNTLFGYSLFALFIFFGVHYSLAVLLSTLLGILFNFKTIGRLVFRNSNNGLFFRFVAVYAATYGLNVAGLRLLSSLHLGMYLAGFLLLAPLAVLSFILQKKYVFRSAPPYAAD